MADDRDLGTEVIGLTRRNTGDPTQQPSLDSVKKPELERHISAIPQSDAEAHNSDDQSKSKTGILRKLKNKIADKTSRKHEDDQGDDSTLPAYRLDVSDTPANDYDSKNKQPQSKPKSADDEIDRYDSGHSGSDFVVTPMLSMSSDEHKTLGSAMERPDLERHISQVPQKDDRSTLGGPMPKVSKLERTISHIPQDDYDSDEAQ